MTRERLNKAIMGAVMLYRTGKKGKQWLKQTIRNLEMLHEVQRLFDEQLISAEEREVILSEW